MEHNHLIGNISSNQQQLTIEEQNELCDFLKYRTPSCAICDLVYYRFGKTAKTQDINNLRRKLQVKYSDKMEELEGSLKKQGSTLIIKDEDSGITHICWASHQQIALFDKFPEVICVDGTHGTNREHFILYQFVITDGFGTGRSIFYALIRNETSSSMKLLFDCFKNIMGPRTSAIKTFVMDKMNAQISAVEQVFDCSINLCYFHVKQAINRNRQSQEDTSVLRPSQEAKKPRLATSDLAPSRVLHLSSLPHSFTELDVVKLAVPFGLVTNLILNKHTDVALLEMASQEVASSLLAYYSGQPRLGSNLSLMQVKYSKYQSLSLSSNPRVIEALEASRSLHESLTSTANGQHASNNKSVIIVIVHFVPAGVQLGYRHFYQLFSQFGTILRIVVFKTENERNALIEFDSSHAATVAKLLMDNSLIPAETTSTTGIALGQSSSYRINVDFSKQSKLEVLQEDVNCRDFVRHPLTDQQQLITGSGDQLMLSSMNRLLEGGVTPDLRLISSLIVDQLTEDVLCQLDPSVLSLLANRLTRPLINAANNAPNPSVGRFLSDQASLVDQMTSTLVGRGVASLSSSASPSPLHCYSPVVYVSNLNYERVTPDALFTLFGAYGDVQRVKIMYNRKETALIQLADPQQAQLAIKYLDGVPLYGKTLRCASSKIMSVIMSKDSSSTPTPTTDNGLATGDGGANNLGLTHDYSNSPLHRFSRANSKNRQNICRPSSVLHVSNLPDHVSSDQLKVLFASSLASHEPSMAAAAASLVKQVRIISASKRMALIELEDIGHAVTALIALDNHQVSEGFHIRVSFSKFAFRS